jgi:hypothetical protein
MQRAHERGEVPAREAATGKDANPLDEVEVICGSPMNNGASCASTR